MLLGVLGDTHIPGRARSLSRSFIDVFTERGIELILFTGDLNTLSTLKQLSELAPVYAVRGDIDFLALPANKIINVEGVKVGITHGDEPPDEQGKEPFVVTAHEMGVDVLVLGHSHTLREEMVDGMLVLNPGSATGAWVGAGIRRPPSAMILDINGREVGISTLVLGTDGLEESRTAHQL